MSILRIYRIEFLKLLAHTLRFAIRYWPIWGTLIVHIFIYSPGDPFYLELVLSKILFDSLFDPSLLVDTK